MCDSRARYTYAVQTRIEQDGKLIFMNDTRYPVIPRGAPTHVEIVLEASSHSEFT